MIKIMIADDEMWIRTSLKNKINWSDSLILCGEASNGFEALDLAGNLRPDIIITDVRMPGMDGLELISRLLTFLPDLQPIIISGYNEFSYVKSAIELNACGYVLKPIHKDELNATVDKAIAQIHRNNLLRLTTQSQLNLLHTFLQSLYHNEPVSEEHFQEVTANLKFHSQFAYILLIRFLDSQESLDYADQQLNKVIASISSQYICNIFVVSDTIYGIYLTSQLPVDILQYSRTLMKQLSARAALDVSIALSPMAASFHQLPAAFEAARRGLALMHPYSIHEIILPQPPEQERKTIVLPKEIAQEIIDSIYSHNSSALREAIEHLNHFIRNTPGITLYDSNRLLYLLLGDLMRILYEWNCSKELIDQGIALMKELSEYQPGKDYPSQFYHYCQGLLSSTKMQTSIAQSVHSAEQYILSNYQKNISLKDIASLFYLNPSYFSASFKNITGKNFSEYLTSVRMEQAKLLLNDKTLKINQIARMVGYEDCSYFGKSFRKYTGLIPSEYQKIYYKDGK